MRIHRYTRMFLVLAVLLGLTQVVSFEANASTCGGDYAPDFRAVQAKGPISGNLYQASVEFFLSDTQVANLQCRAAFLEIDFKPEGFVLPTVGPLGWIDYRVKSNLPGAQQDSSLFDGATHIASATGIPTDQLVAQQTYFVEVEWRSEAVFGTPNVHVTFVPSRWASVAINPVEWAFCKWFNQEAPYCIFGLGMTFTMSPKIPFSTGGTTYVNGPIMPSWLSGSSLYDSASWQTARYPTNTTASPLPLPPEDPPRPTALQYGSSELSVFHRDADTRVHKNSWNGTSWSSPSGRASSCDCYTYLWRNYAQRIQKVYFARKCGRPSSCRCCW